MTTMEKWNSIVADFQTNKTLKEDAVQKLWEEIFSDANVFGYSKRSREIDVWRNIQIGSRERTIPDIIIRESIDNKDLFVIELKQHNLPFNQAYKEQLFSYMRLLELKVGILICEKLFIYYRENCNIEYSIEIPFTENSMYGEKFIELFSKGEFNQQRVKDFLIETEKTKSNVSEIKRDLQQLDIRKLLVEHYCGKYSIEEIEFALKNLQISISFNAQTPQPVLTQTVINNSTPKFTNHTYVSTPNYSDYYEEPQDIDYIIIKTSQKRVDFCNGSIYEATRYAWNVKVEHVQQYKYVFGVINGIVRGVYCVDEWRLVTTGDSVGRYEFYGYDAPKEIANRFLGKRIPPQYSKRGLASPVLYKK